MSRLYQSGKTSVDLKDSSSRSRIRRDQVTTPEESEDPRRDERDTLMAMIGVLSFALAIVVIIMGFASAFE